MAAPGHTFDSLSKVQQYQAKTTSSESKQSVDVYVDPAKHPDSAGHVQDAQGAGQPDTLTIDRAGASARRDQATSGHPTQPGTDRDEYPPAATAEGGRGASVRNIQSGDNRGSGASLGQQIKDLADGTTIKVNVGSKPQQ
jgi:hypothetical protein